MKNTFQLLSKDVDEIEAHLSEAYFPLRVKPIEKCSTYGMVGSSADFGEIMIYWSKKIGSVEIWPIADDTIFALNIVKSGLATYKSQNSEIHVRENSAILQKPDWKANAWHGSEYCTVTIKKNAVHRRLVELLDGASAGNFGLEESPVRGRSVWKLFNFLNGLENSPIMELAAEMNHRSDSVKNLILDALIWSYPNNYRDKLSKRVATVAPRHVKRAVDYIQSSPEIYHSPEFLASLSSVSLRSLQYSFKTFTGHTISDYQNLVRLERASKDMIANPEVLLSEICLKWGFSSLSSFSRAFKRTYGQTASSFLRQTRKS